MFSEPLLSKSTPVCSNHSDLLPFGAEFKENGYGGTDVTARMDQRRQTEAALRPLMPRLTNL